MKPPVDLAKLRELTTELIHSLGFVIEYSECAVWDGKSKWPAQVAEDLNNATDMAVQVCEQAQRLKLFVAGRAVVANKTAAAAKRKGTKS